MDFDNEGGLIVNISDNHIIGIGISHFCDRMSDRPDADNGVVAGSNHSPGAPLLPV